MKFTNDQVEPCDRNLRVDWVRVGETTYQTETAATRTGCGGPESLFCAGDFNFGTLPQTGTSFEALAVSDAFRTYPNPVNDQLIVRGTKNYRATVYDLQGRPMLQQEQLTGTSRLDVSWLRPGVYMVRLQDAQHPAVYQRIVVE